MISSVVDHTSPPRFDEFASSYSELLSDPARSRFATDPLHFHLRKWYVIRALLERAGRRSESMKWLDVGCGRGELLNLAKRSFAEAHGCDPSKSMSASCRGIHVHVQHSANQLPFESHSFDFVSAVCVYHHVPKSERNAITAEIRRVLRPGGLFCMMEHNPLNPITSAIVKRCPVDAGAELLTAREGVAIAKSSGFTTIEKEYFLYLPEKIFSKASRIERLLRHIPMGGQFALLLKAPAPHL